MKATLLVVLVGLSLPAQACDTACQIDANWRRDVDRRERAQQQSFDNESRYFLHRQEQREADWRAIDENRALNRIGDALDELNASPRRR